MVVFLLRSPVGVVWALKVIPGKAYHANKDEELIDGSFVWWCGGGGD